jgi:hypothetical protein
MLHLAAMDRLLPRVLAATILAATLRAAPASLSLRWDQLDGTILNQQVIVDLNDGSRVKAVVTAVNPAALAVRGNKGPASIPREQVAGLRLIRMRLRGRIIGAAGGQAAGALGGVFLVMGAGGSAASVGGFFALGAGVPIIGYFVGRKLDRQEIPILILPDAAQSSLRAPSDVSLPHLGELA